MKTIQQSVKMVQFVITLVLSIFGAQEEKTSSSRARRTWNKLIRPLSNQAGVQVIEVIGWALVGVLAIVVVWGLINGWLPNFINSIFNKLSSL